MYGRSQARGYDIANPALTAGTAASIDEQSTLGNQALLSGCGLTGGATPVLGMAGWAGVSGSGLAARMGGPSCENAGPAGTEEIPNQDIIYEQLAHVCAYGGEVSPAQLAAWGYAVGPGTVENDAETGFGMTVFVPTKAALADPAVAAMHQKPLRTVIAFRGTDPGLLDLLADVTGSAVGEPQFQAWFPQIQAAVRAGATPDVIGHSLGGALAQLTACRIGGVNRVVTFQAPAVRASDVAMMDPDIQSTHYRAEADMVTLAGEELTPGEVVTLDDGATPILSHTDLMLAELNDERVAAGGGVAGIEGTDARVSGATHEGAADQQHSGEGIRCAVGGVCNAGADVAVDLAAIHDLVTGDASLRAACEACSLAGDVDLLILAIADAVVATLIGLGPAVGQLSGSELAGVLAGAVGPQVGVAAALLAAPIAALALAILATLATGEALAA